ncbi:MAG: redox-sensing transcriptional repressor Rex [Desulfarculaceae bacterium]|jgi:redox-sensing transcriptional repressor
MKDMKIPAATITRLSIYSRVLERMVDSSETVISSKRLAQICGVNPAQIRKDLAYFGQFGVRGVGYFVKELLFDIKKILGLNRDWKMALVGAGNLGCALVAHENFAKQGYSFVCAFDNDPEKVGLRMSTGVVIAHINQLEEVCRQKGAEIGVICVPPENAQEMANRFMDIPMLGILNFAPVQLQCHASGCKVENVDFTVKLDNLAYHLTVG